MDHKEPELSKQSAKQLTEKKAWIKPDIEFISSSSVKGGPVHHYTEFQLVFYHGTTTAGFS